MKILLLFALLGATYAITLEDIFEAEWSHFKHRHNKQYDGQRIEEGFRKKIFLENSHYIAQHNIRHAKGLVSYQLAMNEFGDMLHHEFIATRNGFKRGSQRGIRNVTATAWINPEYITDDMLPKSVDWRKKGAVTEVKNQGQCGSCWAFSTTGALEGQLFRKTKKLVSISEQNLVDCSGSYGNNGCNGGLMDQAFEYIKENKGIDSEQSYPYVGRQENCKYKASNKAGEATGFVDVTKGSEKSLDKALATVGPVSIAIDASHQSFQFYSKGVYDEPECDSESLDHGVLAVGYGTDDDGTDYYIVKNSWGPSWGKEGYVLMSRNKDNQCGVASQASYPLV